ncbi:MAG: LUD domain-containing protein [Candidatus Acidiferrales bacterium]|jgi:L-lactate dehydrogenase complex protein LldG
MEQAENPGRERILARIRGALRETAPKHGAPASTGPIFAPVRDPFDRFQKECSQNLTECVITSDMGASAAAVAEVLASISPGQIFVQDAPELRCMVPLWPHGRNIRWSSEGGPLEASQATITLAEALVAQTGSVFVSSSCGGRAASVAAPVHIVVATLDQLVPDLDAAFARLRERRAQETNSMLCLITGSSRTADIEKILVMGAHGPRRLVVVLALRTIPARG